MSDDTLIARAKELIATFEAGITGLRGSEEDEAAAVLRDLLAALTIAEQAKVQLRQHDAEATRLAALLQEIEVILAGGEASDFALSYSAVRAVADLKSAESARASAIAERDEAIATANKLTRQACEAERLAQENAALKASAREVAELHQPKLEQEMEAAIRLQEAESYLSALQAQVRALEPFDMSAENQVDWVAALAEIEADIVRLQATADVIRERIVVNCDAPVNNSNSIADATKKHLKSLRLKAMAKATHLR